MNYASIKYYDIANGPGVRTSLFVSGCTHACKGCFNREAWDFDWGEPFTETQEDAIIASLRPDYISGLTILGGEPMEPVNQKGLLPLLRKFKKTCPQKNLWCYTGYTFEEDFLPGGRAHTPLTEEFLSVVDVLVDGKFIQELYEVGLLFRGSKNQRLIDIKMSKKTGGIVLYDSP